MHRERIDYNISQLTELKTQRQEAVVKGDSDRKNQIISEMDNIYVGVDLQAILLH